MILSKIAEGAKIGFYGVGCSCQELLGYLPLQKCSITLRSDKAICRSIIPDGIRIDRIYECDNGALDIDEDILIFSPSVKRDRPEFIDAMKRGTLFTSDCEIFFEENEKDVFAVTGSDGKSTTATIACLLLSYSGDCRLIGNIGVPMTPQLKGSERYVAELSSFMLEYISPKCKRACLTSLSENHLDFHESYEEYKETKISLLKSSEKYVISDTEDHIKGAFGITSIDKSYAMLRRDYDAEIYLTIENGFIAKNGKRLLEIEKIKRRGALDLKNLMMAIALTDGYADEEAILRVASDFSGLEHRQELFLHYNGVDFYNSSIDTSPARTVATLESIGRPAIVILGGRSKGLDYSVLCPALKKYARYVIICGENADEISLATKGCADCTVQDNFDSAVRLGAEMAREIGALILSPASTSYDKFSDYKNRGKQYKNIIFSCVNREKSK